MLQHLQRASRLHPTTEAFQTGPPSQPADLPATAHAKLLHYDQAAPIKVATAFLFHQGNRSYDQARQQAQQLTGEQRRQLLANQLQLMERHDPAPREFEQVHYTLELTMNYGALREFRRHRLQSLLPQPPTISLGANIPDLIQQTDLVEPFRQALDQAEHAHRDIARFSPAAAQYLVTHSHLQRMITTFNLREAYHLFKLRNSPAAHPSVREPLRQAQQLLTQAHPDLFEYLPALQQ